MGMFTHRAREAEGICFQYKPVLEQCEAQEWVVPSDSRL